MAERLITIELAARRLGMTAIVDSYEVPGYHAPTVEEDMNEMNELVWGSWTPPRPDAVVQC